MLGSKFTQPLTLTFCVCMISCEDPLSSHVEDFSTSIVTNKDTGEKILLESENGKTVVTRIATGESLTVDGEFAGIMTDDEYTDLMREKRQLDISAEGPEPLAAGKCQFSISKSFTCPKYSLAGNPVEVYTDVNTYNKNGDAVQIHLYRYNAYWVDDYFGFKEHGVKYNGGWDGWDTWTNATKSGQYYVKVSKVYSGYWSYGYTEF